MSTRSLRRFRAAAFVRQHGRCYYCKKPMWLHDPAAFGAEHGVTPRQARQLRCTAEHLRARQDGGRDTRDNIVAAHLACNRGRHRRKVPPSPERWKEIRTRQWRVAAHSG